MTILARLYWISGMVSAFLPLFILTNEHSARASSSSSIRQQWQEKANRKIDSQVPVIDPTDQIYLDPQLRRQLGNPPRSKTTVDPLALRNALIRRKGSSIDLATGQRSPLATQGEIVWNERNGTPVFITGPDLYPRTKRATPDSPTEAAWISSLPTPLSLHWMTPGASWSR